MLQLNDFVINEENYVQRCFVSTHGGEPGYGLVPRNYGTHPVGWYEGSTALRDTLELIQWSDMPGLIAEKVANKSQLSDIRNRGNNGQPFPSLDQNGKGYCWAHSGTSAAMLLRARDNQPYVRLSAYAIACIIKNYRDQGGWGAQGLDFMRERGVPSVDFWPEKSMNRGNDNPQTWENAALHKITEGFIDLDAAQYDRNLSFQQVLTCLLNNIPVITDYNWWGHSVCAMDAVDVYPNRSATDPSRYGVRILNSWSDQWGERGTGVLTDRKAVPDGAVAPRAIMLSDA